MTIGPFGTNYGELLITWAKWCPNDHFMYKMHCAMVSKCSFAQGINELTRTRSLVVVAHHRIHQENNGLSWKWVRNCLRERVMEALTVFADGLAPLGAGPSADTVLTSWIPFLSYNFLLLHKISNSKTTKEKQKYLNFMATRNKTFMSALTANFFWCQLSNNDGWLYSHFHG